jgi:putative addiction module killer protein
MKRRIVVYESESGKRPFGEWLRGIRDERTVGRILQRIDRAAAGNTGDCKSVGDGVYELRYDFGPGYRVYFGYQGSTVIVLLIGGDKSSQSLDIRRAIENLKDFKKRVL